MPVTPFHGGIGLLCKPPLGRHFSFTLFFATQIAIDLESAYYLVRGEYPVHRFFHTFVGAGLVCVVVALILRRPCEALVRALPREWPAWVERTPGISVGTALLTALVGVVAHVVPDSIMHADARPLSPFSDRNPFLGVVSLGELHLGLICFGTIGILWLRVLPSVRRR